MHLSLRVYLVVERECRPLFDTRPLHTEPPFILRDLDFDLVLRALRPFDFDLRLDVPTID